jgi:signal peptidase I
LVWHRDRSFGDLPADNAGMRLAWLAAPAAMFLCGCATGSPTALPSANVFQVVKIDGASMMPTLASGTMVLADREAYEVGRNGPKRGDIVLMESPSDPTQDFVKRIVGLPGDVIEIDGTQTPTRVLLQPGGQGAVQVLHESYLPDAWTVLDNCCSSNGEASSAPEPLTIPSGEYFVLGDNRNFSSDSRVFGLVPVADILAQVVGVQGSARELYSDRPTLGLA